MCVGSRAWQKGKARWDLQSNINQIYVRHPLNDQLTQTGRLPFSRLTDIRVQTVF